MRTVKVVSELKAKSIGGWKPKTVGRPARLHTSLSAISGPSSRGQAASDNEPYVVPGWNLIQMRNCNLSWHAITFPAGAASFDDPALLINEARAAYEQAGSPAGFLVYKQTQADYSVIFFFSPVASSLCKELLMSCKACQHNEPVSASKPLTQIIP